jgi:hypothetical protein
LSFLAREKRNFDRVIPLPNDPTTPEFRAAYSAALVDAIAMENDSDE